MNQDNNEDPNKQIIVVNPNQSSNSFMDTIRSNKIIVLIVIIVLIFLIYWFCIRKKSAALSTKTAPVASTAVAPVATVPTTNIKVTKSRT